MPKTLTPSKPIAKTRHALTTFKPDFEDARKHWEAFWVGEVLDRPVISIIAQRDGVGDVPGLPYMAGHDGKFDEPVARLEKWIETRYWGGDAIPRYTPGFGPDMFAGFLGAKIEYTHDTGTSWAVPFVEKWEKVLPLKIDSKNELWSRLQAFVKCLTNSAKGRWLIGNIDMHSNMDAVASIRNPERLCMDMLDQPEHIETAMRNVRALFPYVTDTLYKAANGPVTGTTGWIGMYSEKKFNVTQCDFCCMVSNDMFRRFILPALRDETEHLDHSVYHLDGPGALRHLDDLLALPKLNAIQWVPGAGAKPLREWPDVLHKILSAGKALHIYCGIEEVEFFHRELGPKGVFYDCWAKNEAEANRVVDWLKKNT
jgi:hypothetical protein